tara:strand:- start:659 stop:775 length:117 start_codon:yes stop_codon:yes gene_type:complete
MHQVKSINYLFIIENALNKLRAFSQTKLKTNFKKEDFN